jgi:hypothetical protein
MSNKNTSDRSRRVTIDPNDRIRPLLDESSSDEEIPPDPAVSFTILRDYNNNTSDRSRRVTIDPNNRIRPLLDESSSDEEIPPDPAVSFTILRDCIASHVDGSRNKLSLLSFLNAATYGAIKTYLGRRWRALLERYFSIDIDSKDRMSFHENTLHLLNNYIQQRFHASDENPRRKRRQREVTFTHLFPASQFTQVNISDDDDDTQIPLLSKRPRVSIGDGNESDSHRVDAMESEDSDSVDDTENEERETSVKRCFKRQDKASDRSHHWLM